MNKNTGRRSLRLVAAGVVLALVATLGAGSAALAAPGPVVAADVGTKGKCVSQGQWTEAMCMIVVALMKESNPVDYTPKDMQLAAPGGTIASTSSTVKDVNRWRPNPQAWVDAKSRVAAGSGLTSKDIAATSRWAPKLFKGAGVAAVLSMAGELAWSVRDDYLYPALGMEGANIDTYCVREGNFAMDLLGGLAGTNCPEWRLGEAYRDLVQGTLTEKLIAGGRFKMLNVAVRNPMAEGGTGSGICGASIAQPYQTLVVYLREYSLELGLPQDAIVLRVDTADGQVERAVTSSGGLAYNCDVPDMGQLHYAGYVLGMAPIVDAYLMNKYTGEKIESAFGRDAGAEFITEVECADGTSRWAVSESFQQEALGAIAHPAAVQLDGCKPVSTRTGMQPKGTGITPDAPWEPKPSPGEDPKPGRTTVTETTEVPDEVREWMENFPQCWDGSCRLTLKKQQSTSVEVDCFEVPDSCVDWFEESKTSPTKYKCYYAGQARPLSDCFVYSRVFDRQNVQRGTGYAEPETGIEPKVYACVGCNDPRTATTNRGAEKESMNTTPDNPEKARDCWPSGWAAFNPFEWVLQPIKCALQWAFVPRQTKVDQTTTKIRLTATNSRVAEAAQVATTWAAVAEGMNPSGCAGPSINLNLMGIEYSGTPLTACAEPTATLAFWSRIIIGITAVLAAVYAVSRYIGRVFGYDGFGRTGGGDS